MLNRYLAVALLCALPFSAGSAEGVPGATVRPGGDRAAMMERCKADPEKCRAERQAQREKWCASNPDKCKEMKARMEQCKANPEKCRAERQAKFDERFKKADLDGNGAISRAEAEKGMPRIARRFERLDSNKDGQVTRAEFESARKERMDGKGKDRPKAM